MNNLESAPQNTIGTTKQQFSKNACCGIYGLKSKSEHKWYIGHSRNIQRRFGSYRRLSCKSQPKLYAALQTQGVKNFEMQILEECSPENLLTREKYWTTFYDAVNNGYNSKVGGYAPSDSSRQKMSDAHKGKKLSDEHKRNISRGWRGLTDEGKIKTEEKRQQYLFIKNHPELWTPSFKEKIIIQGMKRLEKQKLKSLPPKSSTSASALNS